MQRNPRTTSTYKCHEFSHILLNLNARVKSIWRIHDLKPHKLFWFEGISRFFLRCWWTLRWKGWKGWRFLKVFIYLKFIIIIFVLYGGTMQPSIFSFKSCLAPIRCTKCELWVSSQWRCSFSQLQGSCQSEWRIRTKHLTGLKGWKSVCTFLHGVWSTKPPPLGGVSRDVKGG